LQPQITKPQRWVTVTFFVRKCNLVLDLVFIGGRHANICDYNLYLKVKKAKGLVYCFKLALSFGISLLLHPCSENFTLCPKPDWFQLNTPLRLILWKARIQWVYKVIFVACKISINNLFVVILFPHRNHLLSTL
jgi:hypothetical protein